MAHYQLSAWDLAALLPNAEAPTVEGRLQQLESDVAAFEAWRERLHASTPADLRTLVQQYEAISAQAYVLSAYGSLWFAADTQSSAAITYMNRMQQALTAIQNRLLFFAL